jgi:hypothetical protein
MLARRHAVLGHQVIDHREKHVSRGAIPQHGGVRGE